MMNNMLFFQIGGGFPILADASSPVGVFDVAALMVLLFGIWQGRKQGMSRELLPLIQWIATVASGAALYKPIGGYFARFSGFGLLWSYLSAYLLCVVLVSMIMGYVKRAAGEKMTEKETFGGMEYYFGMASGLIRCACIMIVILAAAHAPYYTDAEIEAKRKAQIKELGSEFFPSLGGIQRYIFRDSFIGSSMERYTPFLLIDSTTSSGAAAPKDSLKDRRQREFDDTPAK
jgi:hypothetical protein